MTLVVDSLVKTFGSVRALDGVSFAVGPGEVFGFLGANGAGKTTTMRVCLDVLRPDSGTVTWEGRPNTTLPRGTWGYLPEERGLYKKMKVMEQLIFMGELRGLDKATASKRARDWCERLQIVEAVHKKTEELSKGMQQKIQFIATLLHEPELIVMDEPFSGLDPVNASLLQDTLIEQKKAGKAILFSTHRMDQVEKMCDAICLIHRGHAVLQGGMREVKSRYERDHVVINYEGDAGFLQHPAVESFKDYGGYAEIKLTPGADSQELLRSAMEKATIFRFELMEPSLEEIFIRTVGEKIDA